MVAATVVSLLLLVAAVLIGRFFNSKSQFRLATLLLMVPVVALPCGWLGKEVSLARSQFAIVSGLSAAEVHYDKTMKDYDNPVGEVAASQPLAPDLLRTALGRDFFDDVTGVVLGRAEDKDIELASRLPRLCVIRIGAAQVSEAGLEHIQALSGLQWLDVDRGTVGDDALRAISGCQPITVARRARSATSKCWMNTNPI